jgi:hypothetical protein
MPDAYIEVARDPETPRRWLMAQIQAHHPRRTYTLRCRRTEQRPGSAPAAMWRHRYLWIGLAALQLSLYGRALKGV